MLPAISLPTHVLTRPASLLTAGARTLADLNSQLSFLRVVPAVYYQSGGRGTTLCTAVPLQYDGGAAPASQQPPLRWRRTDPPLARPCPHITYPPNRRSQKSPRQQQHSQMPQQPASQEARKHWNPVRRRPSPRIHNSPAWGSALQAPSAPPLPLPAPQKETVLYIQTRSPFAAHLIWLVSSHTSPSRFSSAPSTLGAGCLIAMAGAMKTFWVLLLVVAMAAVAAQAHDGEDHGPAGAPHAEAPDIGSGAELLASWLSPLLMSGAAFAASFLWS